MVNENAFPGTMKTGMVYRAFKVARTDKVIKLGSFPPMPTPDKIDCPMSADDVQAFAEALGSCVVDTSVLDITKLQVCTYVCVCVNQLVLCVCI